LRATSSLRDSHGGKAGPWLPPAEPTLKGRPCAKRLSYQSRPRPCSCRFWLDVEVAAAPRLAARRLPAPPTSVMTFPRSSPRATISSNSMRARPRQPTSRRRSTRSPSAQRPSPRTRPKRALRPSQISRAPQTSSCRSSSRPLSNLCRSNSSPSGPRSASSRARLVRQRASSSATSEGAERGKVTALARWPSRYMGVKGRPPVRHPIASLSRR
jgi:hypothetical protein